MSVPSIVRKDGGDKGMFQVLDSAFEGQACVVGGKATLLRTGDAAALTPPVKPVLVAGDDRFKRMEFEMAELRNMLKAQELLILKATKDRIEKEDSRREVGNSFSTASRGGRGNSNSRGRGSSRFGGQEGSRSDVVRNSRALNPPGDDSDPLASSGEAVNPNGSAEQGANKGDRGEAFVEPPASGVARATSPPEQGALGSRVVMQEP